MTFVGLDKVLELHYMLLGTYYSTIRLTRSRPKILKVMDDQWMNINPLVPSEIT